MRDEQRRADLAGVLQRRDAVEHRLHLRDALVAVLGAAQVAAVALGVVEEGGEVGDDDHVDAGADAVAVVHQRSQHHVAAVAAAVHAHALGIELGLLADPVEQRADVFDRILALLGVVQAQVSATIAGRAAHVRHQHGHAEFVGEELRGGVEGRQRLRFRAAVDLDQHRQLLARGGAGGPVVERRNRARLAVDLIEGGIAHQRRRNELGRIQAADFAAGPARQLARLQVDHVDV
ncbi:hypothetical protein CATMIT_01733, partial [Catenibacterium mitsuokai DSM 15897]